MRQKTRAGNEEVQLVVFRLYGESFGIEITKVREIIKPTEITHLPQTADYIEGVINLRGEVIPVVNLRTRFGLSRMDDEEEGRIIIVEIRDQKVGLIVDAVSEVLRLSSEQIGPAPTNVQGLKTNLLEGVGRQDDRLIILLSLEALFSTDDQLSFEQVTMRPEDLDQLDEPDDEDDGAGSAEGAGAEAAAAQDDEDGGSADDSDPSGDRGAEGEEDGSERAAGGSEEEASEVGASEEDAARGGDEAGDDGRQVVEE